MEYYGHNDWRDYHLAHYGVKGMQWHKHLKSVEDAANQMRRSGTMDRGMGGLYNSYYGVKGSNYIIGKGNRQMAESARTQKYVESLKKRRKEVEDFNSEIRPHTSDNRPIARKKNVSDNGKKVNVKRKNTSIISYRVREDQMPYGTQWVSARKGGRPVARKKKVTNNGKKVTLTKPRYFGS